MGDGAVVCMPSQQRDIMERFPVSESACGGRGFGLVPEKKMKEHERKERAQKQEERRSKEELEKGVPVTERRRKGEPGKGERGRNGELEKGEFVPERSHKDKGELEKGEFAPDKWRRGDLEVGEFVPDEWRKWEDEKPEHESGRSRKVELEKGELVPDKWRKGTREHSQEDIYQKKEGGSKKEGERRNLEKGELALDKWPKVDKSHANEDHHQKKEVGSKNQSEPRKRSSLKCDGNVTDRRSESGSHKHEMNNGKGHLKDHNSTSSLKRHCVESDSSTRKHHGEHSDNLGSKSRRISEDSNSRSGYQDKPHNSSTAPSRNSSMNRYSSSRQHESSLPSRGHERHVQKPGLEQTSYDRTHQHHHRDCSPVYSERSSLDRVRHHDRRDRTPGCSERSPHERLRHHDRRDRTPGRRDRSPHDRARHHVHRDRTPGNLERSPHNSGQVRESGRKGAAGEKQLGRYEEKPGRRDSDGRDSVKHSSVRQSGNTATCPDKIATGKPNKEKESHNSVADPNELPPPPPFSPPPLPPPPPPANGFPEDSMEEDMDICDTPPHGALPVEQNIGKWYYLDNYGLEQGPSKLTNLKRLVEEGVLPSDHLIKHVDSDRWVTVENATSPLLSASLTSVVSDVLTQMVSPPEASGNLLVDDGDITMQKFLSTLQPELCHKHDCDLPAALNDLHIDERIDALLNGYDIIPGRELEILGDALKVTFEHVEWENWSHSEGFTRSRAHAFEAPRHPREDGTGRVSDGMSKESIEARLVATSEKELAFLNSDSSDWFAGLWSCKGGDWKRNDDNVHDRNQKRKLVLNEGYPLCQMSKCGDEDPRWHRRDDLYYPSRNKKFDVPSWALSWMEDKNENNNDSSKCMLSGRSSQVKPVVSRGVKGVLLPVVRINACVVRDHGSVSESRPTFKSIERHSSRSVRPHDGNGDKSSFPEGTYRSKMVKQHDSSQKYKQSVNIPKDHVCTMDELSTHLGDWFYLDAAGHEHGPFLFSELQDLVAKGTILKHSSVFRKVDNVWIPITGNTIITDAACSQKEKGPTADRSAFDSVSHNHINAATFHSSHPQFIGYTRGKLHELVMKSFKSREFAAAINEVLDPWITAKQPKKELEKHFTFNSSITKSSVVLSHDSSTDKFWRADGDAVGIYGHAGKRARLMLDESDEDFEQEDDQPTGQKNDSSFEDLFGEDALNEENFMSSKTDSSSWGLLNDRILARVFHFLRADAKSLVLTAATCKHWRATVKFYWNMSKQVDLSHLGTSCTDSMFRSIMSGCDKNRITSIILSRCSNISATALEEVLHLFPDILSIDIRGCNQFRELMPLFQNVKWIKSHSSLNAKNLEESHSKMKSLKRITDKGFLSSKTSKESISHLDDLRNSTNLNAHDFHLDREGSATHTFRQGYYKRTRLPDARKSSAALSRDAQLRQLLRKKSVTAYRKMEGFIGMRLKEIMKENTFEFFVLRVAEIEEKMRNGHYSRLGLSSVKEDISRMCRDALKVKRRGDSGDMKQVVMLFFQLAKNLDNSKMPNGRDDMVRSLRDNLDVGFFSEVTKHRKKNNRNMNDKRLNNRTNNIAYANGGVDYEPYEIDRELKRSISKPNRRHLGTESETSEENDLTEDDMMSGIDGTTSGTDSELDIHLESRKDDSKDGHFMWDDSLDSISDDREWGARMTKASLVPPVTRKYEVIDKYLVVADEEEVKRKMTVALPEDYDEKVRAQKSGLEESDMEIPEVKDYKPRKMLGVEVIEQEVYGIDPYTHNLLLDSMPDEADWPLVEKQKFIEEVLLRTLNKQVRHFTGSGNTPMVYHLKSVVEEIKRTAEESGEPRLVKLCHAILKAMQSRPDDNYVAYRKGLGVVCNKEGGFGEDDFVVEFLGEALWLWVFTRPVPTPRQQGCVHGLGHPSGMLGRVSGGFSLTIKCILELKIACVINLVACFADFPLETLQGFHNNQPSSRLLLLPFDLLLHTVGVDATTWVADGCNGLRTDESGLMSDSESDGMVAREQAYNEH
ncbi:hypothetical protein Taro_012877 [Colocasia esculenta]|uniref:ATXR3 GYF domain-containing protein n=1 Tax=Colocasia esculenta TaxID=4460 RepID=A0A843UER5_COLES|nr:hypothetical protein [Colocasia esculenta]